jgi:hypothetical protein
MHVLQDLCVVATLKFPKLVIPLCSGNETRAMHAHNGKKNASSVESLAL